jgi:DNA-binding FrmR family transcriptional regulator
MTTDSSAESTRKIANRLKRAQGQLGALIVAVENGTDCRAVITQLSAVSSALDRAGFAIVATAMKDCLDEGENGDLSVDELEKLFLTLA